MCELSDDHAQLSWLINEQQVLSVWHKVLGQWTERRLGAVQLEANMSGGRVGLIGVLRVGLHAWWKDHVKVIDAISLVP